MEAVEGDGEEEAEQDLGDEDAGEEEDAGGGEHGEAGVEGGAGVEGARGPLVAEQREQKHGDGLGQVRGEAGESEEAEADGDQPVGQRGLFEVADAVDVERDPVAALEHVAGGVGVGGVGVVEQRRGEEGGAEEEDPKAEEQKQRGRAARAGDGLGRGRLRECGFEQGLGRHGRPIGRFGGK